MPKPSRTATQLQRMLRERIDAIPELTGQLTDVDLGGVVWAAGGTGSSWTVQVMSSRDQHRADVARIIRQLQSEYDLEIF